MSGQEIRLINKAYGDILNDLSIQRMETELPSPTHQPPEIWSNNHTPNQDDQDGLLPQKEIKMVLSSWRLATIGLSIKSIGMPVLNPYFSSLHISYLANWNPFSSTIALQFFNGQLPTSTNIKSEFGKFTTLTILGVLTSPSSKAQYHEIPNLQDTLV